VLSSVVFVVTQVITLGSLFRVYQLGRHLADGRETEALGNARELWGLERILDLPDEATLQHLALHSPDLLRFANRFYLAVHFPAAILFLLWVMIRHRDRWPRVRTVILLSTGAALVVHILYPLAPPRFLPLVRPDVTVMDTGAVLGPSAYGPADTIANQYAAMPSLHVGWAVLEAWGVITILRARARWSALLQPALTTVVVVITANHYWLDGLIGGVLVFGAVQVTRPEARVRIRAAFAVPLGTALGHGHGWLHVRPHGPGRLDMPATRPAWSRDGSGPAPGTPAVPSATSPPAQLRRPATAMALAATAAAARNAAPAPRSPDGERHRAPRAAPGKGPPTVDD
jgi:PAP2 superfamily